MFERKRPHAYLVKTPKPKAQNVSRVPVPKCHFTVFSTVENRMCKRGYRATGFGTRAVFIRAVPKVFGIV